MHFLNPISLLSEFLPEWSDGLSPEQIKQARKVILAELELQQAVTLMVNGQEWDKDSILKGLEQLGDKAVYSHYHRIHASPALEAFLLKGDTAFFFGKNAHTPFEEADFVKFVMPYFAPRYQKALLWGIQQQKHRLVKSMCELALFIPPNWAPVCYEQTFLYLKAELEDFKQNYSTLGEDGYRKYQFREIRHFTSNKLTKCIDSLPDYFDVFKTFYFELWDSLQKYRFKNRLLELVFAFIGPFFFSSFTISFGGGFGHATIAYFVGVVIFLVIMKIRSALFNF